MILNYVQLLWFYEKCTDTFNKCDSDTFLIQ